MRSRIFSQSHSLQPPPPVLFRPFNSTTWPRDQFLANRYNRTRIKKTITHNDSVNNTTSLRVLGLFAPVDGGMWAILITDELIVRDFDAFSELILMPWKETLALSSSWNNRNSAWSFKVSVGSQR